VGSNAAVVYTNTGDTINGLSGAELDSSTIATTAGLQLRILGVDTTAGNEAGADFCKVRVRINNHSEITGIAGT
jgi:hypothetical protein